MATFNVVLNSLARQTDNDKGTTLEFKESQLKTCNSLDDAKSFCKNYRPSLKKHDTLYIYQYTPASNFEPASETALFFMDTKRYGAIF
jgi:hypothetical protein